MSEKIMGDPELATQVLDHANQLAVQTLGSTALLNASKLTFEVGDRTVTLERTVDNLEKLVTSANGQPYDRAIIMYGEDEDTHVLAVGAGYDMGIDAAPDNFDFEFLNSDPQLGTPNVLRAGQLALLVPFTSRAIARTEMAHGGSVEAMFAASDFLATRAR